MDYAANFVVLILMLIICYWRKLRGWVKISVYAALAVNLVLLLINNISGQIFNLASYKVLLFGFTIAGICYISLSVVLVSVFLVISFIPVKIMTRK